MTTKGLLHYHSYRVERTEYPLEYSEKWTVLSSTWTQEESVNAKDEDEAAYMPVVNVSVEWYVTDQCDCEQTPDVWTP